MHIAFSIATLFILIVTLLPLWRNPHWSVRGLDFPRLQFAILAALILLTQILFSDWGEPLHLALMLCTAACLIFQLSWILPYTVLWPKEVHDCPQDDKDARLSIMTANVLTPNRNAQALLAHVSNHQPDILVTLESDLWWEQQLDTLGQTMPYSVKCPLDNLYGMHVYSRLPLHDTQIAYLVEDQVPSIHALAELEDGSKVRLHLMHPAPPSPTENPESGERDAELMILARSIADSEHPVIVTGDLNDVAWSASTRLFRKISKLLDPRVGRGMYNTYHAHYPFLRWPLDHLFHSKHFCLRRITRLSGFGSDHFALFAQLSFNADAPQSHTPLQREQGDKQWAREITAQQNAKKSDVPLSEK